MDESWLPVAEAAADLELSELRVRELLGSGVLSGRKLGGIWLIDPLAVQRRSGRRSQAGRPLSARNAWRLLRLLSEPSGAAKGSPWAGALGSASAVDRSRLRALLADLPDAEGLAGRLASRAQVRPMRAHPGVLDQLLADDRISVGAGRAVAAHGGGVAAGGVDRAYMRSMYLPALVDRYRLRDDVEGNVELAVIPDQVDVALLPEPGRPVALQVAWVDLLDDLDSRARSAAREWVSRARREMSLARAGQR
jgi:hypothetical protein